MDPRDDKPGKYEIECGLARKIAGCEPGDEAAEAIAEAVTSSDEHTAEVYYGVLRIVYRNSFGPTCAVDDVLERMNMTHWEKMCVFALKRMLKRVHAIENQVRTGRRWPVVSLIPERDTPILAEVHVSMPVSRTVNAILEKKHG